MRWPEEFYLKYKWKLTHINPCVTFASERKEAVGSRLVQQHNPCPGGTTPAELLSSCQCCRKSPGCQTLWTERDFINNKYNIASVVLRIKKWLLALINSQDLWVEVLNVVFLHHVLIYGQPRRLNAQVSGPGETQLLQTAKCINIISLH